MVKILMPSAAALLLASGMALAQTAPPGVGTGASGTDQPGGSAVGDALNNAPAPVGQAPLPSGNKTGAGSYGSPSNGGGPLVGGTTSPNGPDTGASTPEGSTAGPAASPIQPPAAGTTTPGSGTPATNSASGGSSG